MRKIILIILVLFILVCGCVRDKENNKKPEVSWSEMVNSNNDELYDCIMSSQAWHDKANTLWNLRTSRFPEYDYHIGSALVWQIEKNTENSNERYHVMVYNVTNEIISEDIIERINEENNLNLNISDWAVLHGWQNVESNYYYYYTFTAEEIIALAVNGLCCAYVGSGIGNADEVDMSTEEGIDVFCEIYGDQYAQYKYEETK